MFREGDDTVAEVCFRILTPPVNQIDPIFVFALLNVEPFEDTAQGTCTNNLATVHEHNYSTSIVHTGNDHGHNNNFSEAMILFN